MRPESENEWWALGQHFGLATPLLDWTHSPYSAAYFAFEDANPGTEYRIVFGLDTFAVKLRNNEIDVGESIEVGIPPVVDIVDPLSDDNPRLVSQGALFTRAPLGTTIEAWVANAFEATNAEVLLRIEVPETERLRALRALDRMNIRRGVQRAEARLKAARRSTLGGMMPQATSSPDARLVTDIRGGYATWTKSNPTTVQRLRQVTNQKAVLEQTLNTQRDRWLTAYGLL